MSAAIEPVGGLVGGRDEERVHRKTEDRGRRDQRETSCPRDRIWEI